MDEFPVIQKFSADDIKSEEEYEKLYTASTEILVLLSIVYGSISVIAVIGNSLVIWIVATTRHMHTVTNMYIANLALADVIIGVFCIPFQFQAALLQRWNLPDFMCYFCPFVQMVSVNVSVFTLTAIAIDRHRAIINPLRAAPTKFVSKIVISGIWIVSIAFSIPCIIAFRVVNLEERVKEDEEILNVTRPFCDNVNLSEEQLASYRYSIVFVQYVVPFCVISYVYIQMAVKLWGTKAPGNAQNTRDKNWLKSKKKVIKMLIIVVIVFGICWLPLQTYNVLYVTYPEINEHHYISIIWFTCDWLAMSNSCYNPFIYGIYNEKFKREFNNRFCCRLFKTTYDKNMSMHTRASSVRSTYFNSSIKARNNISLQTQTSRTSIKSNNNSMQPPMPPPPLLMSSNGFHHQFDYKRQPSREKHYPNHIVIMDTQLTSCCNNIINENESLLTGNNSDDSPVSVIANDRSYEEAFEIPVNKKK
ncbi:tkr-3 family protein [Megaselia abdita]